MPQSCRARCHGACTSHRRASTTADLLGIPVAIKVITVLGMLRRRAAILPSGGQIPCTQPFGGSSRSLEEVVYGMSP